MYRSKLETVTGIGVPNAVVGQADVGPKSAYIYSGILSNSTYTIKAYLMNQSGGKIQLSNGDILSASNSDGNGLLSDFIINNDGTFSFTYTTGAAGSPHVGDGFNISLNGTVVLSFWTNGY